MSIGSLRHVLVSGVTIGSIVVLLYLALLTENSLESITAYGIVLTTLISELIKAIAANKPVGGKTTGGA